jgi:hypothetical protein
MTFNNKLKKRNHLEEMLKFLNHLQNLYPWGPNLGMDRMKQVINLLGIFQKNVLRT